MVSLKQKRGRVQIGRVFTGSNMYVNLFLGDCVGSYIPIVCSNWWFAIPVYILDAVMSSGILKAKQKLGVTFNFDKQILI